MRARWRSHGVDGQRHFKNCIATWPGLLEAWLVLTSVKYHGNLYILIPLNQRLALTRLRATGPCIASCSPARMFALTIKLIIKSILYLLVFEFTFSPPQDENNLTLLRCPNYQQMSFTWSTGGHYKFIQLGALFLNLLVYLRQLQPYLWTMFCNTIGWINRL